jgi:hypothetical protein
MRVTELPQVFTGGVSAAAIIPLVSMPVQTIPGSDRVTLRFGLRPLPREIPWEPMTCPNIDRILPLFDAKQKARNALAVLNLALPLAVFGHLPMEEDKAVRKLVNQSLEVLRVTAGAEFPKRLVELVMPTHALREANLKDLDLSWLYLRSTEGKPLSLKGAVLDHTNFSFSRVKVDFTGAIIRQTTDPVVKAYTGVLKREIPAWMLDDPKAAKGPLQDSLRLLQGVDLTSATEFYNALLDGTKLSQLPLASNIISPQACENLYHTLDADLPEWPDAGEHKQYNIRSISRRQDGEPSLRGITKIPLEYGAGAREDIYTRFQEAVMDLPDQNSPLKGFKPEMMRQALNIASPGFKLNFWR